MGIGGQTPTSRDVKINLTTRLVIQSTQHVLLIPPWLPFKGSVRCSCFVTVASSNFAGDFSTCFFFLCVLLLLPPSLYNRFLSNRSKCRKFTVLWK